MTKESKILHKRLAYLLHWAKKISCYRRDRLSPSDNDILQTLLVRLKQYQILWHKKAAIPSVLPQLLEEASVQLKRLGKPFYPTHFWSDNAEVLWVAAFVAITLRTFFLQPFRIPTCSMFPSFSGMLTRLYDEQHPKPSVFTKPLRWICSGAENYYYQAPCDGTVSIPLFSKEEMEQFRAYVRYEVEYGREIGSLWCSWLLPKPYKIYTLWIDDQPVRIRVPFEFADMEALLRKKFFPQYDKLQTVLESASDACIYDETHGLRLQTQTHVHRNQPFLHFDILLGDMVFVDRLTYHFRRPKIGEAIVFRTGHIPALNNDIYYIKRLVGIPKDLLEIRSPVLYRNGQPIDGSLAFANNHQTKGLYAGYQNAGLLDEGMIHPISVGHFFGLGDNSPHSYDSRFWGEIPERDVIGKALFVLHPFSWRWGWAEKDKGAPAADSAVVLQ